MEIAKIIERENQSQGEIYLYREGLFWKAYEQSAWRFSMGVCSYKCLKKFIKAVNQEVVALGFPTSVFQKHVDKVSITLQSETELVLQLKDFSFQGTFQGWKDSLKAVLKEMIPSNEKKMVSSSDWVEEEIKRFSVESKTPMECMMFIADLKQKISNQEHNG